MLQVQLSLEPQSLEPQSLEPQSLEPQSPHLRDLRGVGLVADPRRVGSWFGKAQAGP